MNIPTSKGQVIIMNQLKCIYNSYSHPTYTWFVMIASNDTKEVNKKHLKS